MNGKFTWDELMRMDIKSLEETKKVCQESLYKKQKEKIILAQNILSLQEMIDET